MKWQPNFQNFLDPPPPTCRCMCASLATCERFWWKSWLRFSHTCTCMGFLSFWGQVSMLWGLISFLFFQIRSSSELPPLKCTSLQRPGLLIWFYLSPVCFARASVDPLHVVLALCQFWCNIELLQTIAWMYVISNFFWRVHLSSNHCFRFYIYSVTVGAVIYICCVEFLFEGSQSDEEKLKQQSLLEKVRKVWHIFVNMYLNCTL